jgi:hypothetical protein
MQMNRLRLGEANPSHESKMRRLGFTCVGLLRDTGAYSTWNVGPVP